MSKKDKRIDAYLAKSADFAKPVLTHLRKHIHNIKDHSWVLQHLKNTVQYFSGKPH